MNTEFYDTNLTTVDYQIVFTKRDYEALLEHGTVVVTESMSGNGFAAWKVAQFIRKLFKDGMEKPVEWSDEDARELAEKVVESEEERTEDDRKNGRKAPGVKKFIGLKDKYLEYLQVDHQVLGTLNRRPGKYDEEQVKALQRIAEVLGNKL